MADIIYTPSQLKAIKTRNKNIIVSAAAGSGKTRVLVDRVIDLIINDKVDIDKMIIVTFTNKASIEMKDRITIEIVKQIEKDPLDKFLKNQLKLIKHAHIQTLHSFASDMLREYFYFFKKLSPNFKVISDSTNVLLKQKAIDQVFSEQYEIADENFHEFIHNFSTSRNDKEAKDVVLKTFEKSMAEIDPLFWLKEKTSGIFDFEIFKDQIRTSLKEVLEKIEENQNLTEKFALRDEYKDLFAEDYNLLNEKLDLIEKNWDLFIEEINKIKFKSMIRARKDEKDIQAILKSNRDLYKKKITDLASLVLNTNSDIVEKFSIKESNILKELAILTEKFMDLYQAYKKEKSYLDFNDMEHYFIKLLDNEKALSILKNRFKYIFFDEYQDSNEIQNHIIEKLKSDENLFFVGDVKQSIYGFRRANPKLFLEKLDFYENGGEKSTRINLNENFRTDKDILNFDNFIFDKLMSKKFSGIDYKNGGHRLNPSKEFESLKAKSEIHILDKDLDESNHIAHVIEGLISDGYQYKDIAILLRSGAKSYQYENAFKDFDIPFFNDIRKISFAASEVNFFTNILKYVANPKDDLSLLAVLRSDIYNFSEDDLAKIKLYGKKSKFYENFETYDKDDEIFAKINDFKTEFEDFSYQLSLMNLYEFGNYIFEKSTYYTYLLARDRASDRVNNVEAFIELMSEYENDNDDGIYGFLTYVENLSLYQTDNLNAVRELSENENLVRIMTIHKSKGLEFPVVILADTGKRFNNKHLSANIVFDEELGIGINVSDYENKVKLSSIRRDLINEKISMDNKKEEMRVLYVALTRPINKLIIVGSKNLKTISKIYGREDYENMTSYIDWILAVCSTDQISSEIFDGDFKTNYSSNEVKIMAYDKEEDYKKFSLKDIRPILDAKDYDKDLYQNFVNLYEKEYEFINDSKESIKKSVTEITKNFNPENDGYELPLYDKILGANEFRKANFILEKKEFKPTDIGTIIHKVFQGLTYKNYDENSLDEEFSRLIKENKIKKEELKVIEKDKILKYFSNPSIKNLYENAKAIRKEESFLMKYEDYFVNGQIDLIFEFKDYAIVLDFKTDRKIRQGFYDKQLAIYKRAIEESLKKKVSKSLIYWYNFGQIEEI